MQHQKLQIQNYWVDSAEFSFPKIYEKKKGMKKEQ